MSFPDTVAPAQAGAYGGKSWLARNPSNHLAVGTGLRRCDGIS